MQSTYKYPLPYCRPRPVRGLTLLELLLAVSIMSIVAGTLGMLARGVRISSDYSIGYSTATQHARVTMERINRMVNEGLANESFPGAAVFADTVNGWTFPDTLVVWHPPTTAANPTGLPLFSELVVYCPSPSVPNQLLEITSPSDTRTVPALSNTAAWKTELTTLKTGSTSNKVLLSDLVRVAAVTTGGGNTRGAVRFVVAQRPSATQWSGYRAGSVLWANINWPQTLYGMQGGLAQTWVRTEIQLMTSSTAVSDSKAQQVLPFFGSAAIYYDLSP